MGIETGTHGEMPIFEALEPRLLLDAAWTVMVYFAADNDLEEAAIGDVNEMEVVGSTASVNLLVQLDRISGEDSSNGDWTDTRRGLVVQDTNPSKLNTPLTSIGEANMGDPATLTNFIQWGASTYPADHYAVVLWDHGGGTSGICWDDTDDDHLTVAEVGQALSDSGVYMDIIGFDACLMGMMEVAYEVRTQGDIMVASEQLEPNDGWAFDTFLADLVAAPGQDAATLAASIVTRYGESYGGDETLSAIDLTTVGTLASALDSFAGTVIAEDADWASIGDARSSANYYDDTDYRDFGTFIDGVASYASNANIVSAAEALQASYASTVISNHSGPGEDATGLSIYLPAPGGGVLGSYTGVNFDLLADTQWDEFLQVFARGTDVDGSIPDAVPVSFLPTTIAGEVGFDGSQEVGEKDVDFYSLTVEAGQEISFDIDAEENGSSLDSMLRLFDAGGTELAANDDAADTDPGGSSTDSYLSYLFNDSGTYYIAVSGYSNDEYDPFAELSGETGSTGDYDLLVRLRSIEPISLAGPDGFGYIAYPVATEFEDISGTGAVGLDPADGDDDVYFQLDATELDGFEFNFYGTVYQELYVSDNGLVTFGSGYTEYENTDLTTSPSQASIAPYWDDLVIAGSPDAAILWEVRGSGGQQRLILQWNNVRYAYGSGLGQVTFQAVLDETDNSMQFNYLDLASSSSKAEGASATIGIKDAGPQSPGGNVLQVSLDDGPNNFVGTGKSTRIEQAPTYVMVRHVFYNNSDWDENDPAAGSSDDNAIASDKVALRPGQTAAFANYTSYSRGINGIMIDIARLVNPAGLTDADFVFRVGNDDDPGSWDPAPVPVNDIAADVRLGAGVGGSDRVTIIWADNAIEKQWLEVTVLSDANGGQLGLAEDDVFYFGNAIGDTGDFSSNAWVGISDFAGVREHPRNFLDPAPIDDHYDINRDSFVGVADLAKVRENTTNFLTALQLITAPAAVGGASSSAMAIAPLAAVANVFEATESFDAGDGGSSAAPATDTPMAIDLLTVDMIPMADTSSQSPLAATPTVVQSDAEQRYAVLGASDSAEYGESELEIDLLADLDPLVV